MGAILNLVERNLHEVQVDADRMLFHIPSSSLFASDELTGTIIDTLRGPGCSSDCLLYTSPSPRDGLLSRMPSSA